MTTVGAVRAVGRRARGAAGAARSAVRRMWRGGKRGVAWARASNGLIRTAKAFGFGLLAIVTAGIGIQLAGVKSIDVGPLKTTMSLSPSVNGEAQVALPPLGSLNFDSHTGPLLLSVRLEALDPDLTQKLISDPDGIKHASASAPDDIRDGVTDVALGALGGATLVGMAAGAVLFRSMRRTAICGGLSLVVAVTSIGLSAATIRPEAVTEPRYEGLLVNAPYVVGDAKTFADRYEKYQDQLQSIIINMSRFYTIGQNLPEFKPDKDTARVLHVSDLHLNPASFDVMESAVNQFDIDTVIDTGDITDWGSGREAEMYAKGIERVKVPYVYVRGNHDSESVASHVADQDNAIVLENEVQEVAGLRIGGIGDPRFTPDKTSAPMDIREEGVLLDSGDELAGTIAKSGGADLAITHDPLGVSPLSGEVPLVLTGHNHQRNVSQLDEDTLSQTQGSTGAAGLRGLDQGDPTPMSMSILYFDKEKKQLEAFDDITMGGAGETHVTLQRHILTDGMPDDNTDLVPNPDEVGEDAEDQGSQQPDND